MRDIDEYTEEALSAKSAMLHVIKYQRDDRACGITKISYDFMVGKHFHWVSIPTLGAATIACGVFGAMQYVLTNAGHNHYFDTRSGELLGNDANEAALKANAKGLELHRKNKFLEAKEWFSKAYATCTASCADQNQWYAKNRDLAHNLYQQQLAEAANENQASSFASVIPEVSSSQTTESNGVLYEQSPPTIATSVQQLAEAANENQASSFASLIPEVSSSQSTESTSALHEQSPPVSANSSSVEAISISDLLPTDLFEEGQKLWNEAWKAENDEAEDRSNEARTKFQEAKTKFDKAQELSSGTDCSKYAKWSHICSLKVEGNDLLNQGAALQEEGNKLMKQTAYQRAYVKYQEAKVKFDEGLLSSGDQRFESCITLVQECITEIRSAIQNANTSQFTEDLAALTPNNTLSHETDIDRLEQEATIFPSQLCFATNAPN